MNALKKVGNWLAPPPDKSEDGRDQWPSRTAFILASMGGCAGMGNLLRYPSQVFNNYGLQWFIPYLMAIFIIAIPVLVLEIAIGQAYRGGVVIAYNNMNNRLKGTGLGMLFIGFVVNHYFVVILAWIMNYFRNSFTSPLPWTNRADEFYMQDVVANVDPIPSTAGGFVTYPGIALVGETVGWTAFTWFLVWLCIFRGVGLTGRVVYFTMGLPIIMTIILIGRSVSLPNAGEGIKLYFATWRGDQLANGQLWSRAVGQVFFSTGVGFAYFTSYASYNQKHSNAVMDSIIIVSSNAIFESVAAFAVFGVIGFIELYPEEGVTLGSFTIGFLTLPLAVAEMPGANFWAVVLFFTLMVLGFSSSFAMLDAIVTLFMDAGTKLSRPIVVTILTVISFLLSLPYCTQFGYYLLDGVDRWINDVALIFVVWAECISATTVYRWKDVVNQVGTPAFALYSFGYFGGMVLGVTIAHSVSPDIGAGVGFGLYIICSIISIFIAQVPTANPPKFWNKTLSTKIFWYLAFYSGNQLRHDLNSIIARPTSPTPSNPNPRQNWRIPSLWPFLLRYISAPILAIIYSFSYPSFTTSFRDDPLHILGFGIAHLCLVIVGAGLIVPRWFDVFVPPARRDDAESVETKLLGVGVLYNRGDEVKELEEGKREESVVDGEERRGSSDRSSVTLDGDGSNDERRDRERKGW